MSEASLCNIHFVEPYIGILDSVANSADDVGSLYWYNTTGNEYLRCVECGQQD